MTPELVIFDCDGVLVDSETISLRVLVECIGAAGLAMTPEQAQARFLGRSLASTSTILSVEFGVDLTDTDLEQMRSRLYDAFRAELTPVAGVAAILGRLPIRRCVASSSQPERIRLSLRLTGLLEQFEPHIFSATMVAEGKPAPDLFLHAAAQMGVAPDACLVIEDSPSGVQSAKRAGMRVLAFTGGAHAGGEAHRAALIEQRPDDIFDDMRRLPDILSGIREE